MSAIKWIATLFVVWGLGAPMAQAQSNSLPALADVLEQVTPAVVNIAVASPAPEADNPLLSDPFFRRYFGFPESEQPRVQLSAGSGVIVDGAKGLVLTNHHVVADGERILVTLKDRRELEATLLGSDAATDIAVLKIDASELTAIPIANSDDLRVGDDVVAIGNPFGLGQTVTAGIVSALGRSGINIEGYEDFIQTDASINPGNSGGALIDKGGQLVGINTAIVAPAGGNVGIGFAVPSNMAKAVMDQLVAYGEVRRGRLGISIQDVTPDIARALDLEEISGAIVTSVEPDSPAMAAGLKSGDVVLAIDGQPVAGSTDLRNRIGLTPVGTEIVLTVRGPTGQRDARATIAAGGIATASPARTAPIPAEPRSGGSQ
jgi:serine protease DegQ